MPRVRTEKTKQNDLAYRRAHMGEARDRAKAWNLANPEKKRETYRRYRKANQVKITAQKRTWRKNNPEKHRAANKRWKINRALKICDFYTMLAAQDGACAICRSTDFARKSSGRLTIDHCHVTGKVRGLLCHRCNSMLGHAKDNVTTLLRAIGYLSKAR